MIRFLLLLSVGLGIGYTYGYLHGAAGEESIVRAGLAGLGIHHVAGQLSGAANRARVDETGRQAVIDSIRQARRDSIESLVHH